MVNVQSPAKRESKVIYARLEMPIYRRLKLYAAKKDIKMIDIVSEAIRKYLDELEGKEEEVKE